jgi:hypothetical protein
MNLFPEWTGQRPGSNDFYGLQTMIGLGSYRVAFERC